MAGAARLRIANIANIANITNTAYRQILATAKFLKI
jgi:hypothetical protein